MPEGLEAAKPFIRALCQAQQQLADAAGATGPSAEYPIFVDYTEDVYEGAVAVRSPTSSRRR